VKLPNIDLLKVIFADIKQRNEENIYPIFTPNVLNETPSTIKNSNIALKNYSNEIYQDDFNSRNNFVLWFKTSSFLPALS